VTILLGANNSGKTTILESLYLLPNPGRNTSYIIDDRSDVSNVIHSLHRTLKSEGYSFLMHNYMESSASIEILDIEKPDEKYDLLLLEDDFKRFIGVTHTGIKSGGIIKHDKKDIECSCILYKGRNEISTFDVELNYKNSLLINHNLIKFGYEYIERNWASIMNTKIGRKVANESSELSNDKYSDITIEPFLETKSSMNAYFIDGKRIRMGDLGEGMQSYITTKMLYEIEQPDILLWDDIEAHMNPRMILNIANWFADLIEQDKQIIITTHSLETVKIISGIIKNSSIVLMNLKDGILESKNMNFEEFNNITKKGIDPRVSERFLI
jgi:predicted ATP-dependent endonuclease of OLD family